MGECGVFHCGGDRQACAQLVFEAERVETGGLEMAAA